MRGQLEVSAEAVELLAQCDGRRPLAQLLAACTPTARDALTALVVELAAAGVIIDARAAHRWFHARSANPVATPPTHSEEEAVALPRFQASAAASVVGASPANEPPTGTLAPLLERRRSAGFAAEDAAYPRDAVRRFLSDAVCLAARRGAGRRPAASAGGLAPVVVHVLVATGDAVEVLWYDDERNRLVRINARSASELAASFAPEPDTVAAIQRGVGVLVLSADTSRVCAKYGPRGYRFALLEAGAMWQTIDLHATDRGVPVRAIGGFFDLELTRLLSLPDHVLPLLAILAGAPTPADGS